MMTIFAHGQRGEPMSDFEKLIYASDLIEWIMETDPDWCVGAVRSIVDHVDDMPSAQPEQKKGKWERIYLDHVASGERPSIFYCSSCNQCVPFPTNFCPACGSDNRQS